MPWTPDQATKHTKKAKSPTAKRQWRDVANSVLERTGDDAQAVRTANGVIARRLRVGHRHLSPHSPSSHED